jgi:hypothetical protein
VLGFAGKRKQGLLLLAATGGRSKVAGHQDRFAVGPGIMPSPRSLICGPRRLFGAVALHNRVLRIIGILHFSAKCGVRARDSEGTRPRWLSAGPPERPTSGPAVRAAWFLLRSGTLRPPGAMTFVGLSFPLEIARREA